MLLDLWMYLMSCSLAMQCMIFKTSVTLKQFNSQKLRTRIHAFTHTASQNTWPSVVDIGLKDRKLWLLYAGDSFMDQWQHEIQGCWSHLKISHFRRHMLLETSRIYLEVIYLIGHSHCHTPFWPISILSDQATDRSSYRAELRQRFIPPAHFKPETHQTVIKELAAPLLTVEPVRVIG